MGCDGGTIPTRDELVRLKKKPEKKDKDSLRVVKWKHCTITQTPLLTPVVACEMGRLYNKDTIIEFLLDKSKFEMANILDHIRGLKDVKELQLTPNPEYKENPHQIDQIGKEAAKYICPITGLEMSGRWKFCYLYNCGCTFSERALKEIKTETCTKCGSPFNAEDIILLNPEEGEEEDAMRSNMEARRLRAKLEKKNKKKHKMEASDVGTETKKAKTTVEQPGTSKIANGIGNSKLTNGTVKAKTVPDKSEQKLHKSIQDDPTSSKAFKSLFTTSDAAKNQQKGHWVTYNPCFY